MHRDELLVISILLELKSLVCYLREPNALEESFKRLCVDIADLFQEGAACYYVSPLLLTWHLHNLIQRHDCVLYSSLFLLLRREA